MNLFSSQNISLNENSEIQTPIMARSATTELSSDYTLPEYKPEMRRLISVCASVSPAARYLANGHAEFAGTVRYAVRYEGSDGEVISVELPEEYDIDMVIDNDGAFDGGELNAYAEVVCENINARVTGPRKITVKSKLRVDAVVLGKKNLSDVIIGASSLPSDDIKRLNNTVNSAKILRENTESIEFSDSFYPEDNEKGEIKIISCRAEPFISEASTTIEGVFVRGELVVYVLTLRNSEGALPMCNVRRIPFSETVSIEKASKNVGCRAYGKVTSEKAEVGDDGVIACEVSISLTAEILSEEKVSYTEDVFSMSCKCNSATKQTDYSKAIKCFNANITVGGKSDAIHDIDKGIRVIESWAEMLSSALVYNEESKRYSFSGKAKIRTMLDDGAGVSQKEFEIPVKYELELPADSKPIAGGGYSEWNMNIPICRVRAESDHLTVDCELCIAARICEKNSISYLCEATVGEPRDLPLGSIIVYYPNAEDTLWSVAKRYGCSPDKLADKNSVSFAPEDVLVGVKYLII